LAAICKNQFLSFALALESAPASDALWYRFFRKDPF